MKIISVNDLLNTDREVDCPNGGFKSLRFLLESDGMGYTITKTIIKPRGWQHWHYKNHLESCLCISGTGLIKNLDTGEVHAISPGTMYVLDKHDNHEFKAYDTVVLICVFNPPLKGREVHGTDGSY
ncbi:MAG: ectoine synthase [Desulfobulbaceae bacterium]|nr:ectoine synthase [Desulfobulbaceae bacterium]